MQKSLKLFLAGLLTALTILSIPQQGFAATIPLTSAERASIQAQIATLHTMVLELQKQLTQLIAAEQALAEPRTITPQSIVGLVCYATNTYTNPLNGRQEQSIQLQHKGSGVIISPDGEIATSLHIIEARDTILPFNYSGGSINVAVRQELSHCDVGQIPADAALPTIADIQNINPIIRIPTLSYRATLFDLPNAGDKSSLESDYSDFAILKITSITPAGMATGMTNMPNVFPYSPLLSAKSVPNGASVVTYGFPGDITTAQSGSFETLYLSGSVGTVTGIAYGTQYYANQPLYISTNMEIQLGRSGSPVFWNGYVIGILRGFEPSNRTHSYSVASDLILKEKGSF